MRNLLAFLAALTLTVGGLGWYLDWYKLRSSPAADGHRNVTIDVDASKIGQDLYKAEQNLQKKLVEHGKSAGDKGTPAAGAPPEKGTAVKAKAGGTTKADKPPADAAPFLLPDANPIFTPLD
jgi:hypothetical protein